MVYNILTKLIMQNNYNILKPFFILNRHKGERGEIMDKFEVFIKAILKMIFRETHFDEKRAKESFQSIKKAQSRQKHSRK